MAAYVELYIDQGSTFSNIINITDDITNLPINITGYVVTCQIRKSYYSSNTTAEFAVSIPTPTDGTIILTLDSNATSNIAPGRYVYDVLLKDPEAETVTRVLEGIVNVNPQVTRW